ncbi:hypothetical protein [Thalassomonas actiniarum]|uniref:SGNH hydrolase-type esterase domain-containing protein n=1 Tax=Thalassomonas actiniarum TaxID=485447 RepID=A0AAE9YTQ0_9GAMM|nr:hypothetical protein [Thalassomonas actiniarum]WDD99431.1 hypothetical protein SG35_001730 [Thalassomonas actiniarum]
MHKKLLTATLLASLTTFSAFSKDNIIVDVNNPVVGLIGASYVDPEASINNTVGLTSLNGSSYRGIADYLKATTITKAKGLVYRENAEGGATSGGANGFKSMLQQAQELVEHTTQWADGTHMKAAVIFSFNDCKHTLAGLCPSQSDVISASINNTLDTINYLQSNNVKVFIVRAPSYDDLDFPLTEQIFSDVIPGFAMVDEQGYQLIQDTFQEYVHNLDGVTVIDAWQEFDHMGDGLHPDHKTKRKAAKVINKVLEKALKDKM